MSGLKMGWFFDWCYKLPTEPKARGWGVCLHGLLAIMVGWCLPLYTNAATVNLLGASSIVKTEQVSAELVADARDGIVPGQRVWLGLRITHQPGWHTYWKNSGDSGQPTELHWTLPDGVVAGEIAWPAPQKIPIGVLANYGYEGTVLLAVPVTLSPDFKAMPSARALQVKLKANWLVCRKECIPQEGEFALEVPLYGATAGHAADFDATFRALPKELPPGLAQAQVFSGDKTVSNKPTLMLTVKGLPAQWQGQELQAFPETAEIIETASPLSQSWLGDTWTAHVSLSPQRTASPVQMPWVLALGAESHRTVASVNGTWPIATEKTVVSPELQAALKENAQSNPSPKTSINALPAGSSIAVASQTGFFMTLMGALLGGMILNLMPCVFPVLAIKLLSLSSQRDGVAHRAGAFAYALGVVLSFVLLGALLLILRAGGEALGWGFQLQSPTVVTALALLFTLLGLNLAGMFEVGNVLPDVMRSAQFSGTMSGHFLSGVLAVAVASPCTAPFMGASLGVALGLSPWRALLVFMFLGFGMALPYALISIVPALGRWLPKPGAWMQTFRRFMAFPMWATVVWLVWVLGQQTGIDGVAALLGSLLGVTALVWAWHLQGRARWILMAFWLALLLGWLVMMGVSLWQTPSPVAARNEVARPRQERVAVDTEQPWQSWQPALVSKLLSEGKPVFVDFTAAWCVTCQVNKRTTLSQEQVLTEFTSKNVRLLRADWTRRDPAITAALVQLGRSGVPVYVLYRPAGAAPLVLSELISPQAVHDALASL